LGALLTLNLAAPTIIVGAQLQPTLSVDPQIYIATQLGEVFTINITGTNIVNLKGFEFKLGYNTTLLDALGAVEGSLPEPPITLLTQVNETEGYIWVSINCGITEGNGTLAIITFNATSAEPASSVLNLYDTYLYDPSWETIPHGVEDGEYQFAILNLTVITDKLHYRGGENVEISGNLTLNNMPYQGLVALEVEGWYGSFVVIRTLQTGSALPPGEITIVELFPSNQWGDPQDTFAKGEVAYFYVAVRNSGTQSKNVTLTVNAFDASMVPLPGTQWTTFPLAPGSQASVVAGIYIPDWADSGNGTVYASALTELPSRGGIPYCPEVSATFQITGSDGGTGTTEQQSSNIGNYSLTFKLPPATELVAGTCMVYVSAAYRGTTTSTQVINITTFEILLWGDVNADGRISLADVGKLDLCYSGIIPGPPYIDPATGNELFPDINGDGAVTLIDVGKMDLIYSGLL
jgi:hypothetical protein